MRARVFKGSPIPKAFSLLIVDDDESMRKRVKGQIESVFDSYRPRIDVACDGLAGWECSQSKNYTFYVIDYKMPKMNGIELSNKILGVNPEAHVILYSASFREEIGSFSDKIYFIQKDVVQLVDHLKASLGVA